MSGTGISFPFPFGTEENPNSWYFPWNGKSGFSSVPVAHLFTLSVEGMVNDLSTELWMTGFLGHRDQHWLWAPSIELPTLLLAVQHPLVSPLGIGVSTDSKEWASPTEPSTPLPEAQCPLVQHWSIGVSMDSSGEHLLIRPGSFVCRTVPPRSTLCH